MDREQLAGFARNHEAALLRYAFLLTGSKAEAEDLVQGSMLRLLRQTDTAVSHPLAYVRRMVYHQNCSVVRRILPSKLLATARLDESPAFESDVVERTWMWAELRRLPTPQRAVLVLRYYEGLADQEMAEILGCRRGTVRSLASRAMETLRERIRPVTPDEATIDGRRA